MKKKKEALRIIAKKLKGIPWAIFAGTAVEIYTKGKRVGNDIDIIIPEDKIDEVAQKFNVIPILETRRKDGVELINDYYIETNIKGIPVEFVGKTKKTVIDGKEYKSPKDLKQELFKRVKKKKYLGIDVFVVPIEEVLVQKMLFHRSEKWQDEEDVKLLLKTGDINKKNLTWAFNLWGISKKKQKSFKLRSFFKNRVREKWQR